MLRGSTTGESQPAVVKYGVCANADDADADEELEREEGDGDGDDGAEVPFVAKRASRVRSA
jgi:hypothetical protein